MYIKELMETDGLTQLNMLKEKKLSNEEVTAHYRTVSAQRNPALNAIVHDVKEADYNASGYFRGLPFLIKDLNAVKGAPLTYGSKVMDGFMAPVDDEVVRRYKQGSTLQEKRTPRSSASLRRRNPAFSETRSIPGIRRSLREGRAGVQP